MLTGLVCCSGVGPAPTPTLIKQRFPKPKVTGSESCRDHHAVPTKREFPRDRQESASVPQLSGTRSAVTGLFERAQGAFEGICPGRLLDRKWCFPANVEVRQETG